MQGSQVEHRFAQRVRELREQASMSQTALAAALEAHGVRIDGTAITRLERGTRAIRLGEAAAIAGVFNRTLDQMLRPAATSLDEQIRLATERRDAAWDVMMSAHREHVMAQVALDHLRHPRQTAEQAVQELLDSAGDRRPLLSDD